MSSSSPCQCLLEHQYYVFRDGSYVLIQSLKYIICKLFYTVGELSLPIRLQATEVEGEELCSETDTTAETSAINEAVSNALQKSLAQLRY